MPAPSRVAAHGDGGFPSGGEVQALHFLSDRRAKAVMLALWAVGWAVVFYASFRPVQDLPLGLSDKTFHLAGYAVMTALSAGFCHTPALLALIAAGTVAASAAIEVGQSFLPYRSFELLDIAANATGAAVGVAAALAWLALVVRPQAGGAASGLKATPQPS
jgi:VanZ family protein